MQKQGVIRCGLEKQWYKDSFVQNVTFWVRVFCRHEIVDECFYTSSSRSSVVEIVLSASIFLRHGRPSSNLYLRPFSKLDSYQSEDQDIF